MTKMLPFVLQGINLFITAVLGFIFLPLISKYMTVGDVGLYAQLLSILSLGLLIVGTGTANYNYRFLSNGNFKNFRNSLSSFILFLLISSLIMTIYFYIIDKYNGKDIVLLLILLIVFSTYKFLHSIIYANQRHKEYVVLNICEALIRYSFTFSLIFFGYRYISYFIGNLISAFIVIVIAIYFLRKQLFNNTEMKSGNKHTIVYALKYTSLYMVSGISIWILTSVDILLVGFFLGNEKAGIYSLGYTLGFQIITFILMVINNVYEPKLLSKEYVEITDYRYIINLFLYSTIPIIVFLYFNVNTYYEIFIDRKFIEGEIITTLILFSSLFWGIYKLCSIKFAKDLKPGTYTKLVIIASVINLILNLILINKLGILGAAISSIIAYLFLAVVALLYIYNLIDMLKYILKAFIITLTLFIFMSIIKEYSYNTWVAQAGQIFVSFVYYFIFFIFIRRKHFEK